MGMGAQVYHSTALKAIRQLVGVSSFIHSVFQGSSPGHQAWWRTLFTDHCILYEIFPCRILKNLTNVCSKSVLLGLWNYFFTYEQLTVQINVIYFREYFSLGALRSS